jgi:hypothetical protein
VTATGINDECAPVNYLTAQFGNPIDLDNTTTIVVQPGLRPRSL